MERYSTVYIEWSKSYGGERNKRSGELGVDFWMARHGSLFIGERLAMVFNSGHVGKGHWRHDLFIQLRKSIFTDSIQKNLFA
ncbi:hypothetical protein [Halobacillus sp. BBL2006]|uniref:hypothetical protein n=1 Tax=Halobacillus sp. BBL2006 TaxID=1543706 RepID=UPI000A70FCFD|nr:hypothetical protein [Halobacillus sp. BBL2006]